MSFHVFALCSYETYAAILTRWDTIKTSLPLITSTPSFTRTSFRLLRTECRCHLLLHRCTHFHLSIDCTLGCMWRNIRLQSFSLMSKSCSSYYFWERGLGVFSKDREKLFRWILLRASLHLHRSRFRLNVNLCSSDFLLILWFKYHHLTICNYLI